VPQVLDRYVWSREDLRFMAVLPAHKVGRCPVFAKYLQDLGVARRLSEMVAADDEAIPWASSQCRLRPGHSAVG